MSGKIVTLAWSNQDFFKTRPRLELFKNPDRVFKAEHPPLLDHGSFLPAQ